MLKSLSQIALLGGSGTDVSSGLNNVIEINNESDFPIQDGTSIDISAGIQYKINSFTTAKQFNLLGGAIDGGDRITTSITYTGTADMFVSLDANISIREVTILAPNMVGTSVFNLSNTSSDTNTCNLRRLILTAVGANVGVFTNFSGLNFNASTLTTANGVLIVGSGKTLIIDTMAFIIVVSGGVAIDFGSAIYGNVLWTTMIIAATTTGITAISGLANSGNIPVGSEGGIDVVQFAGPITEIAGINPNDTRWKILDAPPIIDSITDVFGYLSQDTTVTIGAGNQGVFFPADFNTNWIAQRINRWTFDTAGVVTYVGERSREVQIKGSGSISKSGGGTDEIAARINIDTGSGFAVPPLDFTQGKTTSTDPDFVQAENVFIINQDDKVRVEFANLTGTSDVIVSEFFRLVGINGF